MNIFLNNKKILINSIKNGYTKDIAFICLNIADIKRTFDSMAISIFKSKNIEYTGCTESLEEYIKNKIDEFKASDKENSSTDSINKSKILIQYYNGVISYLSEQILIIKENIKDKINESESESESESMYLNMVSEVSILEKYLEVFVVAKGAFDSVIVENFDIVASINIEHGVQLGKIIFVEDEKLYSEQFLESLYLMSSTNQINFNNIFNDPGKVVLNSIIMPTLLSCDPINLNFSNKSKKFNCDISNNKFFIETEYDVLNIMSKNKINLSISAEVVTSNGFDNFIDVNLEYNDPTLNKILNKNFVQIIEVINFINQSECDDFSFNNNLLTELNTKLDSLNIEVLIKLKNIFSFDKIILNWFILTNEKFLVDTINSVINRKIEIYSNSEIIKIIENFIEKVDGIVFIDNQEENNDLEEKSELEAMQPANKFIKGLEQISLNDFLLLYNVFQDDSYKEILDICILNRLDKFIDTLGNISLNTEIANTELQTLNLDSLYKVRECFLDDSKLVGWQNLFVGELQDKNLDKNFKDDIVKILDNEIYGKQSYTQFFYFRTISIAYNIANNFTSKSQK